MAKINLLPWRQEQRQVRKREFFVVNFGVAFFAIIIIGLVHVQLGTQISAQEERNTYIQSEIDKLDGQIKEIDGLQKRKDELLARMKVIEDLQGRRPVVVRVFDEFVRTLPDGVYFKSLERKGDMFTITGVAQSKNEVSGLMRNLSASPWFKNPQLSSVSEDNSKTQGAPAPQAGNAGGGTASPDIAAANNAFRLTVELQAPDTGSKDGDKDNKGQGGSGKKSGSGSQSSGGAK